ncbi:MAG: type II toxin-antitoxin system Phd/YefM family antitoxin [Proteobacteria bacterium]|jgi:hypothetical protein|nr:type II toxin-antitoxin system Phd/YefM family antitoxin [Pseudomonadota bacterium]
MPTTICSHEFLQNPSHAQCAAKAGPVFITDGGLPQHVLLSIEEYLRLVGRRRIVDVLAMPASEAIAFDPPKAEITTVCADSDGTGI